MPHASLCDGHMEKRSAAPAIPEVIAAATLATAAIAGGSCVYLQLLLVAPSRRLVLKVFKKFCILFHMPNTQAACDTAT